MSAWEKKRRIMRRYDQSARVYDLQYGEEQFAKVQTALPQLTLQRRDVILDVGCGTGLLFEHLSAKAEIIVGADASHSLLREARKRAKAHKNIEVTLADADNLPFPNRTFDKAFAITLLQNTPNPDATIREISRVSKPHAKIILTGLRKSFTRNGFAKLLREANLNVEMFKSDSFGKEYVTICMQRVR